MHPKRIVEFLLIGMATLAGVGWGVERVGIGSGLIDPFYKFGAVDEVVYGHAAARMLASGHWGTPVYLDRLLLNKPPLLMWLGATAMSVFAVSPGILRLPVVLAGLLCCVLLYLWMRRMGQPIAACCTAVILLAGNPYFHSMARKFVTDLPLTVWITAAVFVLGNDFRLNKPRNAFFYGALSGAAIMTKSAAGLIPLFILIAWWCLAGKQERPSLGRVALAFLSAAAIAAPWHIYELLANRDWFLAEYLNFQLLAIGISRPAMTVGGPKLWFYLRAMILTDPALTFLSAAALPALAIAWVRDRSATAKLLAIWIAVVLVCVTAFANRASYYVLPLIPAMALLTARYAPLIRSPRTAWPVTGILLALFCVKAAAPDRLWGLDFRGGTTIAAVPSLDAYRRLNRANELIAVMADDQSYSSVIGLPGIRYVRIVHSDKYRDRAPFLIWLGIEMAAAEFCGMPSGPLYEQRLKAWHAPGTSAIATTIVARSPEEVAEVIRCSPDRDFMLPDELGTLGVEAGSVSHRPVSLGPGRLFLLATNSVQRPPGPPSPGTLVMAEPLRAYRP